MYSSLLMNFLKKIKRLLQFPFYFRKRNIYRSPFQSEKDVKFKKLGQIAGISIRIFRHVRTSIGMRIYIIKRWASNDYSISSPVLTHTSGILFPSLLFFAFLLFGDFIINNNFRELLKFFILQNFGGVPNLEFIKLLTEIIFGSISALLAIIFSLHSVAFQVATEKYSSKVIDHIQKEPAINYFFALLVSTDLLALLTLLQAAFTNRVPIFPFIVLLGLTFISLALISVIKYQFLSTTRPSFIFGRLKREIEGIFKDVINEKKMDLKLPSTLSWSWADNHLDVFTMLIEDLLRNKRYAEAAEGLYALASLLRRYIGIKHGIDSKIQHWWFPRKQRIIKGDNLIEYTFKANFESLGIGSLSTTELNESWFEDRILGFFRKMQREQSDQVVLGSLIEGYKLIAAGEWESDNNNQIIQRKRGSFQCQDHHISDICLKDFFDLYPRIPKDLKSDFINALNEIRYVIIDGFWVRINNADLKDWREIILPTIESLYQSETEEQVRSVISSVKNGNLPTRLRSSLLDFALRIEIEIHADGQIITPKEVILTEINSQIEKSENEWTTYFLDALLSFIKQTLRDSVEKKEFSELSSYVNFIFFVLRQLVRQRDGKLESIKPIFDLLPAYIRLIPVEYLKEVEIEAKLQEEVLDALIKRNKDFYPLQLLCLLMVRYKTMTNQTEQEAINRIRFLLVLGGLAYLISELDQNPYFVTNFAKILEGGFVQKEKVEQALDLAAELRKMGYPTSSQIIFRETTMYDPYYRVIFREIADLPVRYVGRIGSQRPDHPSAFIQNINLDHIGFVRIEMDDCMEEFVEWMKKRTLMSRFINALPKKQS